MWCTAHTEQEFDAESKLLALQSLHADPTADINQKLTQFNAVRHSLVTLSHATTCQCLTMVVVVMMMFEL